jgi:hypothetical protein
MVFQVSSYHIFSFIFMTIKSLKKEERINKDLYRDFPNSCNSLVICHNYQKAVIINHRPSAVPEGFSGGVSAKKCFAVLMPTYLTT